MHASFSSDGRFVISADTGGSVRVWSVEAGKEVLCRSLLEQLHPGQRSPVALPAPNTEMTCVDFSPNGQVTVCVVGGFFKRIVCAARRRCALLPCRGAF